MENQSTKDILDHFKPGTADPGQDFAGEARQLFFPDYPNMPGDFDDLPPDSPWHAYLKKRKAKKGRFSFDLMASDDHDEAHDTQQSLDDRLSALHATSNELLTALSSRQAQKAVEKQAKDDFRRWVYAEKYADSQRQREHEEKMEAMRMEMEERRLEHKKQMAEPEMRKMQLEIELQRLKNEELAMKDGPAACP